MNRNGIVQCIPAVFFSAEREDKREGRLHCGCSTCLSMCTQTWVVNQKQVIKPYWYHFNKADVCRSSPSSLVKVPAGIDYSKSTLFMSIMVFFLCILYF